MWACSGFSVSIRSGRRLLLASNSAVALLIGGGSPALACYSGPFTGGYTNNITTACIAVSNTSFSGNLVNNGKVTPGNTAASGTGVLVTGNSTITGQISNAGTIAASGDGILVSGTGAVVTNGVVNNKTILAPSGAGIHLVGSVSTFGGQHHQYWHN